MVFYNPSDERFLSAANTRKREIEGTKGFDGNKDNVYIVKLDDLGKMKKQVDDIITDAKKNEYGKTVEVAFYTHGALDGPTGDFETSGNHNLRDITGNPKDKLQLSPDGWREINWNFDEENSIAAFYGCQTSAFADVFLDYSNVKYSAGQEEQTGPTYRLDKWSKVYYPGEEDNVYYSGGDEGLSVYSRASLKTNEYGHSELH